MIYKWLHQCSDAKQVVVFFNGWGFDDTVVATLTTNNNINVLIVSDYSCLETQLPDLKRYDTRTLVAWSFGVANYTVWQQNNPDIFDFKVAINGTMRGIDRSTGIAEVVVQHTIDTLNVDSFIEFQKRCYNSNQTQKNVSKVNIAAKKNELQHILDRHYLVDNTVHWNAVWISQQDKIFPTKNQFRAWEGCNPELIIEAAHAPFSHWFSWQDLLPFSK